MNVRKMAICGTLAAGLAVLGSPARALEGVSPGAGDRMATVGSTCPTFSWGMSGEAAAYDLVAYVLPEDASKGVELTTDTEALYTRVSGGATSWTPSAEQCFAPGGRYVWFVRAVSELDGDEVVAAGEWSAGRYFTVPDAPSPEEMQRALDVLKRWEAANGGGSPIISSGTGFFSDADPDADSDAGWASPKSVPTASAAIRGEHPDTSGEKYGVVGVTSSFDGAGVAAANLGSGPDLVLDGSAAGAADARLWEGGLDRPSAADQSFVFANSGSGLIDVHVQGDLSGNRVTGDELWVPYGMVVDDEGRWQGVGDVVPCAGCVGSSDIADGGVDTADLAAGAVTGVKLAAGAVGASAIRSNAVTNTHLADGAVTSAEILDGSITAADVDANGGIYVSKPQLYEREASQPIPPTHTGGGDNLQASCDDANDLPVSGSCDCIATGGLMLKSSYAVNWVTGSAPASWECFFKNTSVSETYTGYARILCIAVP